MNGLWVTLGCAAAMFVALWAWALAAMPTRDIPAVAWPSFGKIIILAGIVSVVVLYGTAFRPTGTASGAAPVQAPADNSQRVPIATPTATATEEPAVSVPTELPTAAPTATWASRPSPAPAISIDYRLFPRPPADNGRGLHWFPTSHQDTTVVDRFVPELVAMHIKWLVIIQGLEDYGLDGNTYLVQRLIQSGIMPVMRIEARIGAMDLLRLRRVVVRYRALGVAYFQIYNEPNLPEEWADGQIGTPERFAALWQAAAEVVIDANGLPGIAAMSPNAPANDFDYLRGTLEWLAKAHNPDTIRRTWLAVHNYSLGQPVRFAADDAGYGRYRRDAAIARQALGVILPMIGTEGGPQPNNADPARRTDDSWLTQWYMDAYRSLAGREAYWFAFSPWLIGNMAGGGTDPRWENAAWFKLDRTEPVVPALGNLP